MIRRLLLWLTARLPAEEIAHQGVKFMERYYVATLLGWRVYIHRFVGSDPDGLHDHPWRWGFSLILCGWYIEQRRDGHRVRRWGNMVNGGTFHRVIVPHGAEAWTLFAHDRRCKQWGFLRHYPVALLGGGRNRPAQRAENVTLYVPANEPRGHSSWHLTAPKGRDIRAAMPPAPAVFRRRSRA